MRTIKEVVEFNWDEGNQGKNLKHNVTDEESEEVFFDQTRYIFKDIVHSQEEERLRILGKTKHGRLLFIVFTKRKNKIRIILARPINKKEVSLYEKAA